MTLTEIINDQLGHPDIYGHPVALLVDAVPKTGCITAPVVTDEGAGRTWAWMVELAEDYWEDDDE